jgi:O-antigen ligase
MIATSGERPRWRSGVVIAVAVGAIAALSLSFGAVPSSDNVVLRRAQELAALTSSDKSIGDQYRVNERQNALENVRRHPVTGLGLGVPWREYHRLPTVFEDGRNYVHIAALWYWLKLGVLGVIAYALFMFAAVHAGWRVWKRQRDPRLRAVGLGAAAAVTGLMVAEATASFTGVEARVSVIFGAMLGWLIAAGAVDEAAHAPLRTPSD